MGGGTEGKINKMAEGQMRIADSDITQKASNITYQSSNITRMSWPDGRYFGEAGGSGKSMIHQFGENVGRYTIAGAEL
jgi:hypothetical protein